MLPITIAVFLRNLLMIYKVPELIEEWHPLLVIKMLLGG